jgi:signal transduction histidine kinase
MEPSSGHELEPHCPSEAEHGSAGEARVVETFCYSLSHDLRSLLTRIYTASQALRDGYGSSLDRSARYFVQCICEASESMEERIQAMLALSLVTRQEMQRTELDLSAMATEIVQGLQQIESRPALEFVCAPGLKVWGDGRLVRVVLENLLGNAWKYTRKVPQACVEFGCRLAAGSAQFFVRDNGVGFPMHDSHRLFKPFERLHGCEFPGSGIGLATVQRIVERHGGRIWAEGAVERGATFIFTLSPEIPPPARGSD